MKSVCHEPTIIANTVEVLLTDSSTYSRLHKTLFFSTPIENSVFLHSRKRTALLTAAFTKPRFLNSYTNY